MLNESLDGAVISLFALPEIAAEGIEVSRGTVIFEQGSTAEHVYCIHRGQVRLVQAGKDGEERLVEILGPNQWFGCGALSERGVHVTRAVAATSGQISKVTASKLLEHVARTPEAAAQLIRHLAGSVQTAREDASRLQFQDCNARLVDAMIRFSYSAAATVQGSDVTLHLTHAQLAQAVGAARETISLALTEMRQRNLVQTGRNRLLFNRDALLSFATQQPQTSSQS